MATKSKCYLTRASADIQEENDHTLKVRTPFGTYMISKNLANDKATLSAYKREQYLFAGIIRKHRDEKRLLHIQKSNIKTILESTIIPKTPLDQIDILIQYLAKHTSHKGKKVELKLNSDLSLVYAKNKNEFKWLLSIAKDLGYIEAQDNGSGSIYATTLALKGWIHYDELERKGKKADQAFVAMAFRADLDDMWYQGIRPALEATGWQPLRIDESEHNERIDNKMIAEIRRSGLLVADLTYHRQNVYFEAGFAEGLGIPVVFTGHEDHMNADSVHFDVRQYKYIEWKTSLQLKERMIARIEATGLSRLDQ